jgi:hypothetical protein
VWLSIQYFGLDAFRTAIDRCLDLALHAEDHVRRRPELELLSPANLGVVCFRRRQEAGDGEPETARRNADLVARYEATGDGLVSSTRLRDSYAIRLCVMNHTSAERDVEQVLDWFAEAGTAPSAARHAPVPPAARAVDVTGARRNPPEVSAEEIEGVDLFADLTPEQLTLIAGWARLRRVQGGEQVTRRWDASREFFVVLHGTAEVARDDHRIGDLAEGSFFGELAAVDWGAGYGYPRLATVTATAPMRLLVLEPSHLNRLMIEAPPVAARVREAMRTRLATV